MPEQQLARKPEAKSAEEFLKASPLFEAIKTHIDKTHPELSAEEKTRMFENYLKLLTKEIPSDFVYRISGLLSKGKFVGRDGKPLSWEEGAKLSREAFALFASYEGMYEMLPEERTEKLKKLYELLGGYNTENTRVLDGLLSEYFNGVRGKKNWGDKELRAEAIRRINERDRRLSEEFELFGGEFGHPSPSPPSPPTEKEIREEMKAIRAEVDEAKGIVALLDSLGEKQLSFASLTSYSSQAVRIQQNIIAFGPKNLWEHNFSLVLAYNMTASKLVDYLLSRYEERKETEKKRSKEREEETRREEIAKKDEATSLRTDLIALLNIDNPVLLQPGVLPAFLQNYPQATATLTELRELKKAVLESKHEGGFPPVEPPKFGMAIKAPEALPEETRFKLMVAACTTPKELAGTFEQIKRTMGAEAAIEFITGHQMERTKRLAARA